MWLVWCIVGFYVGGGFYSMVFAKAEDKWISLSELILAAVLWPLCLLAEIYDDRQKPHRDFWR